MDRIFSKNTLREFWTKHPDCEQHLKTWYDTAIHADWNSPNDVKKTYASVSILKNGRLVFNIKGNTYRLIARINFEKNGCSFGLSAHTKTMTELMQIRFKIATP